MGMRMKEKGENNNNTEKKLTRGKGPGLTKNVKAVI